MGECLVTVGGRRGVRRVAVLAGLLTACAKPAPPLGPAARKEGWLLVETPHIALRTDLDRDTAMHRVTQLEQDWQALAAMYGLVAPGAGTPSGPFPVIHFSSCRDFARISRGYVGFVFWSSVWMGDEYVAVTCEGHAIATLLHELAHIFNHHHFSGMPPWVDEGLAVYYSTLSVRDGMARVGGFPLGSWFHRNGAAELPGLDAIRRMDHGQFHEDRVKNANYLSAWKLVHLLNGTGRDRQRRFHRYLTSLSRGVPSEQAWGEAFGDLPAEPLARDYDRYLQRKRLPYWTTRYQWSALTPPRVRPLHSNEVHVLWANLYAKSDQPSEVAAQLDRLSAADPSGPEPSYWRAVLLRPPNRLQLLRDYVSRRPDDERGWDALVELELESAVPPDYLGLEGAPPPALAAMESDVLRLIQRASDALSLNRIGWYFALRQNPKTGLNFAIRALQKEPACGACWDTAALLYYHAGRIREALRAQERAASLMAKRAPPSVLERLERYRAAAAASE